MQWDFHQALPIGWNIWVSHFVASLHPLLDLVDTIWQGTRIASNGCSVLPRTAKERNYITTLPTEEEEEENPRNPFEFSQPSSFRQSLDHRRDYRLITASKQSEKIQKARPWWIANPWLHLHCQGVADTVWDCRMGKVSRTEPPKPWRWKVNQAGLWVAHNKQIQTILPATDPIEITI